jgi:hypothetical protein
MMLAPLVIPGVIRGISILAFASRLGDLADDWFSLLIATCRGVDGLVGSAPDTGSVAAPRPRCAGVTAARY